MPKQEAEDCRPFVDVSCNPKLSADRISRDVRHFLNMNFNGPSKNVCCICTCVLHARACIVYLIFWVILVFARAACRCLDLQKPVNMCETYQDKQHQYNKCHYIS